MNIDGGPMAIIEDCKVIIDDVTSFFRAFNFKGEMSAQQIVSQDFNLTNIKAQDKNGILTFDPIELEYLGSSTKIAGNLDLSRKMPTAQLRLETSASDIKMLAARIFPEVEFRGAMKVITDITATGLEFKNLIGRLQAISQPDRSDEEAVLPVNKVMIKPMMVSASNLKFTKATIKVDSAKVELTANRLSVVEKNRLAIKDLKTFLRNARFDAKTQIKNISVKNQKVDNIRLAMRGDRGILKSDSIELDYFGARTKMDIFQLKAKI